MRIQAIQMDMMMDFVLIFQRIAVTAGIQYTVLLVLIYKQQHM